jgi:hypothetical protein
MKVTQEVFNEGLKIFKRKLSHKEFHHYTGDPRDICAKIVRGTWNGQFFQASTGHFNVFYIRDFGMSVEALQFMGYKEEIAKTLEYALAIYQHYNKITTTITREHKPIDVFTYGADSLPYLMHALRVTKSFYLLKKYSSFLNEQIEVYYKEVFDEKKEIAYQDKTFSSMKDGAKRKSSMYDNCMAAFLVKEITALKDQNLRFVNPFNKWNYRKVIYDRFWVGNHFLDDISEHHYVAADANTIPYVLGIFNDIDMMRSSVNVMIGNKLDSPVPCCYTKNRIKEKENPLLNIFAPNYEGNSSWTNVGMLFLQVLEKSNRVLLKKYIDRYLELVEKHHNFLEVFDPDGKPYETFFYKCDEGMLWSSIFYYILHKFYRPASSLRIK